MMISPLRHGVSALLLTLLAALGTIRIATAIGNYQECVSNVAKSLAYCDMSLSHEERIEALIGDMNLTEKIGLLAPDPTIFSQRVGDLDCNAITHSVPRLGIGTYTWLVETNSQANSACFQNKQCATAFPGALGLAASFNRSVWYAKGDVISTEMRALYNFGGNRFHSNKTRIGLTGFGPNINIARDPRFGRTSELPGEDPYLNGQYAIHYMRGMQQVDNQGYLKMMAFLKHYTAYSRETNRGGDTYNISQRMMFDTYLPAYEMAFKQGKASGVMCSYNGINGKPSCANNFILNTVMRQKWQQTNAIVMTDCGAVNNLLHEPVFAPSQAHAVAWIIGNGTDVEAGDHFFGDFALEAVSKGLLQESVVDESVRRVLKGMLKVGRFDHPYEDKVSWSSISSEAIGSPKHSQVRDDAARQTSVLLRNLGNVLPLKPNKKDTIVVVGPQADTGFGLVPDYWADEACPGGSLDCILTIYHSIKNIHRGDTQLFPGVDEISTKNQTEPYQQALHAVQRNADIVVLVLGISKRTEYEGVDRQETTLPGLQNQFALDVLKITKQNNIPTIVILVNGGALSVDELLPSRNYRDNLPTCYQSHAGVAREKMPHRYAVVEAYNPSLGAKGIVEALFGIGPVSWGRMVTTIYPKRFAETHPPDQYELSAGNGLTYRYHTGDVLATFGEGMPHEDPDRATLSCKLQSMQQNGETPVHNIPQWKVQCSASNSLPGRPVSILVMVFVRASKEMRAKAPYPIPQRALRGFQRVMVDPVQSKSLEVTICLQDLMFVNEEGHREALPGRHFDLIDVWDGWDMFQSFPVSLPQEHFPEGIIVKSY